MNNVIKIAVGVVVAAGTGYGAWYLKKRSLRKNNEQFLCREKQVLDLLNSYLDGKDDDRKTAFLEHPNVVNAVEDFMAGDRNIHELERALKFVNDHLI